MVSNLPITYGDEIAMSVMVESDGEWFKPNSLYCFSPIMFYGEYNDYGTGEECHGTGLHYAADEFRHFKQPIEDDTAPDQFVEKIAREGLKFHNVQTFKKQLNGDTQAGVDARLCMIRKDVLDRILEEYSWEKTFYVQTEDNSYVYETINYQFYLDCIPGAIARIKEYYRKEREMEDALGKSFTLSYHSLPHGLDMKDRNMLLHWLDAHDQESSKIFTKTLGKKIGAMAEANQDEALTDLLTEFSKYCILYRFMMDTRKVFTPQPNNSQDSATDAHRFMAKITTEIGEEMDRERDEEDGAWDPVRQVLMQQNEMRF